MSAPPARSRAHRYTVAVRWTGNDGAGTRDYRSYRRDHLALVAGKPDLAMSADPAFRGDRGRYNPEELLVAALSTCHMLWYLHLCAVNDIVVSAYEDAAEGTLEESPDGGGRFTGVVLRPRVAIASGDPARALALHDLAHERCFIASSVNFPVRHEPALVPAGAPAPPAGLGTKS
jgi:organic hydroperoxide reductase OsmC/OhrA